MINNRLFKKINSIFWGFLTFLPIVILFFAIFFNIFQVQVSMESYISGDFDVGDYLIDFFDSVTCALSNSGNAWVTNLWYNPLSDVFSNLFNVIFDTVETAPYYFALIDICAWVCWVQVMRLFTYVFYWFIDLISGLFDLMTFNRKGDN